LPRPSRSSGAPRRSVSCESPSGKVSLMETAEGLPGGAIDPSDLTDVIKDPGPFLSLYLHTEGDVENAAQRSMTRWKTVRSGLERDGVPGAVLNDVEALVSDAHLHGDGLGVVATAG